MNNGYFITGIGTSVGKTVVSALLAMYWKTSYWKPIQSGDLHLTDSQLVSQLTHHSIQIIPEIYKMKTPESPHLAAELEGMQLRLDHIQLPQLENKILVEGAGGVYVPIDEEQVMLDVMKHLGLPVIIVFRDYLGCINHSLLSIHAVLNAGLTLNYVVFNGAFKESSTRIIKRNLPEGCNIIEIPELASLNQKDVIEALSKIKIY